MLKVLLIMGFGAAIVGSIIAAVIRFYNGSLINVILFATGAITISLTGAWLFSEGVFPT